MEDSAACKIPLNLALSATYNLERGPPKQTLISLGSGQDRVILRRWRSELSHRPVDRAQFRDHERSVNIMKYSSVLSDEEGVKTWLRDYSGELLSVGIELGLTADQQTALQNHLVSMRQGFDAMTTIKTNFQSDPVSHSDRDWSDKSPMVHWT